MEFVQIGEDTTARKLERVITAENLDATLGFTQNVGIGFFTQDAGNSMTITDYTITCGNKVISGLGTCQATLTEVTE